MNSFVDSHRYLFTHYSEHLDPAAISSDHQIPIVPPNPFIIYAPVNERFPFHSYSLTSSPILPSPDSHVVLPYHVTFIYGEANQFRSHLCPSDLLSFYNHSSFLRMHLHNQWLLGNHIITISLPEEFFVTHAHLAVFCGTFPLLGLCPQGNVCYLNFPSLISAAGYLLTSDHFLFSILSDIPIISYHQNASLIDAFYFLVHFCMDFPKSTCWFFTKFPGLTSSFVTSIKHMSLSVFRSKLLQYQQTAEYNNMIDHINLLAIDYLSMPFDQLPMSTLDLSFTPHMDVKTQQGPGTHSCSHVCSNIWQPMRFPNMHGLCHFEMSMFNFYSNLTRSDKALFRRCHRNFNTLNSACLKALVKDLLDYRLPLSRIRTFYMPKLSITQKKMIIAHNLISHVVDDDHFVNMLDDVDDEYVTINLVFPEPTETNYIHYPDSLLSDL